MQNLIYEILPHEITSQQPSLTQLNNLLEYFVTHTTFSTLDIHMQRRLPASPQQAFEEVFRTIGGGNCFRINGALFHVLSALGYQARLFPSRVHAAEGHIYNLAQDSHMTILVEFEQQKYIVDPGWGNMPMQIMAVKGDVVTACNNKWRAVNANNSHIAAQLFLEKDQKWQTQFDFDLNKSMPFADFQPLVDYVNSPEYPLYTFMLIMKVTPAGTHMIANNNWTFTALNGVEETFDIKESGGMSAVLHERFSLHENYLKTVQLHLFSKPLQEMLKPIWQSKHPQNINVQHLARYLSETLQHAEETEAFYIDESISAVNPRIK